MSPRRLGLFLCLALTCRFAHATDCYGTTTLGGCFSALGVSGPAEPGPFRTLSLGYVLPPGSVALSGNGWHAISPAELVASSPDPNGRSIDVVSRATVIDWRAAVGIGYRMDLTLAWPVFVDVHGAGSDAIATQKPAAFEGAALGDPRIGVRANLYSDGILRSMLRNEWSVPLGNDEHYAGDGAATSTLAFTEVLDTSGWVLALDVGYRAARTVRFGDVRLGASALFGLGFARDILGKHELTVGLEAWVNPALVPAPKTDMPNSGGTTAVPAEWLLNVQYSPRTLPAWAWIGGGSGLPLSRRDTANAPISDQSFIAPSAARIRFGLGLGVLLGGR